MTDAPDPLLAALEAIADRTPVPPAAAGAGADGLAVLSAVAGGFRDAGSAPGAEPGAPRWGALVLRGLLGAGSFGEVRLAWDPALRRTVALKLRRPEAGVLRWLDEARALARVRHPNVVTVYGADLRDGRAGMWMEHVEGATLEDELRRRGPLPAREVAAIGVQLAAALDAVHAAGLVHGDVKPANAMIEARPDSPPHRRRVVLMDFGTVTDGALEAAGLEPFATGTPLVTAPEVLEGAAPSARADVYSAAVVLHRLLTGRHPVEAGSLEALRAAHARRATDRPLAHRRDVPRPLARAIARALDPDPARRTASAAELRRALEGVAEPALRARRRLAAAALAVAATAALASLALTLARPPADTTLRARPLPRLAEPAWARPLWTAHGAGRNAHLGWVAEGIGDLDGDGRGELVVSEVGHSGAEFESGRALVFFGSAAGPERAARWSYVGSQSGGGTASNVAAAGDVNGDGHPDLLVAERYVRDAARGFGAVHLFYGDGRALARAPGWSFASGAPDMRGLGDGLDGGGDVNGDGYADILIGETLHGDRSPREGIVRLFPGGPTGPAPRPAWSFAGGQSDAELGWRAQFAGDVDGDGYDDVLVSAAHWSGRHADGGRVLLFRGGPLLPGATPDWTFEGARDRALLGMAIAAGDDVDGDGYDDLVVGEPGHSSEGLLQRGRLLVFRGGPGGPARTPAWEIRGQGTGARLGWFQPLLADLDGDGFAEIGGGSPGFTPDPARRSIGLIVVHRGGPRGPERRPTWHRLGGASGATYGALVATAGDTDGDGRAELLVGAPTAADSLPGAGALECYAVAPPAARAARLSAAPPAGRTATRSGP